jgi:hypothetical protein
VPEHHLPGSEVEHEWSHVLQELTTPMKVALVLCWLAVIFFCAVMGGRFVFVDVPTHRI